jgi:hypothetical protein
MNDKASVTNLTIKIVPIITPPLFKVDIGGIIIGTIMMVKLVTLSRRGLSTGFDP